MDNAQWIALLKQDVVPALGCTEPVCVALCAAYAAQQITGQICSVTVQTNAGIYKNGMSAGIPNCPQVGLSWAAAIGCSLKNPEKQLQLLEDIKPDILSCAAKLVEGGQVSVSVAPEISQLYVCCTLRSSQETVTAIIKNAHTNLVHLEKNGHVLLDRHNQSQNSGDDSTIAALKNMTVSQIRLYKENSPDDPGSFLLSGYIVFIT